MTMIPVTMAAHTEAVAAASEVTVDDLPVALHRVAETATRGGIPFVLRRLPPEAVDAESIAQACGTDPQAVVRCLVYRGKASRKAMLVLASARTQVNERALAQIVGEVLEKVDAATTKKITGFPPESLPPFSLAMRLPIVMDEALVGLGRVWCKAGSVDLVMSVPTMILIRAIAARIARID